AVEGSEVLDSLEQLEKKGTAILACGTCLSFFGIKEKQMVGKASNMPEIITTLLDASKVVTI
ncbi:MAG: DsrE family protein, partial [Candidatus Abyssubacteria bacterium]|nr:DsrE family protein [Candidatus Abyssubacteria bacterium]